MGLCCKIEAIKAFIVSTVTSKWFIANYFVSILLIEFALSKLKPLVQNKKEHIERDKKYEAF
jgi:hypothetical protein